MAGVPLPLFSRTVPMSQLQQLWTNSSVLAPLHTLKVLLVTSSNGPFSPAVSLFLSWICSISQLNWISKSKLLNDGRSVSQYVLVSSPLWDLWPDITSYLKDSGLKLLSCLYGAPSLTRGRVCSLQCKSRAEPVTILYCLIWDSPSTWSARFPYLYPLGPGRSSYTPGHGVPLRLEVRSYFTTDGQSVSMSWYWTPLWALRPDITSCRNVAV
jgi:hypothetical protein